MKLNLIAAGVVLLTCVNVGTAQAPAAAGGTAPHYSNSHLKQMMREAHTPEQYSALASYYSSSRQDFLQKAAEEKLEWERRSQNVMSVAAKYPRPVDSARYLYEYYIQEAAEAGGLSAKYSRLLASPGSSETKQ